MPWEVVTDPIEIAAAQSPLTRNEQSTQEQQQNRGAELRQFIGMTMEADGFNRKLPTGRFAARVNEAGQEFPKSWQPRDVAAYQSFLGLRQRMVKPSMGIMTGKAPMSGEMNTPAEVTMQMSAIPGPEKEFGANRYLGDTAGKQAQMLIARNAWAENWRKNNGSTHKPDNQGRTMDQGFDEYMTKGPGARWANKPMSQYYDEALAKQQPAKPSGDGWSVKEKR